MPEQFMRPHDSVVVTAVKKTLRIFAQEIQPIHPRFLVAQFFVSFIPHNSLSRLRTLVYRCGGLRIGRGSLILGKLSLTADGPLAEMFSVGEGCRINSPFYAELNAPLLIGSHVAIGHHAVFITTEHDTGNPHDRAGTPTHTKIVIEDGAWVGARATILPAVTIGRGSIIAAGSLVTHSVAPHKVVGGVPARLVKSLDN